MRNRKYVEFNAIGRRVWASEAMDKKEMNKMENSGYGQRTGRSVTLDTDFSVQGTYRDWDNEAARRISAIINEEAQVTRF